jgi:hypothetical protein
MGGLRTLILLLWGFNTLSSIVGVLQVYDPNRFAPDARFVQELYGSYADSLKIKIANGESVWRPMGLTDSPGGATVSGQFAFLTGLVLAIRERHLGLRLAGVLGALAGVFCIYLCQVRTTVVLTGLGVIVFTILNAARQRADRALLISGLGGAVLVAGFTWAYAVGGTTVSDRLATLTAERADQVYYANRGIFLEDTLEKVPDYPLGAGLGRWGMMATYFGDPFNPTSKPLHAEIQPAAWLYDGGLLLLIVGYMALLVTCWVSIRIALRSRDARMVDWAILVVALNVGIVANTFTYPVFSSQTGMMCLLLNGALFTAAAMPRPRRVSRDSSPLPASGERGLAFQCNDHETRTLP